MATGRGVPTAPAEPSQPLHNQLLHLKQDPQFADQVGGHVGRGAGLEADVGVGCGAINVICCCFHRNKEIFRKAEEDGVGVLNFEKALKVRVGHGGWGM